MDWASIEECSTGKNDGPWFPHITESSALSSMRNL
jgi:hypothetical protein